MEDSKMLNVKKGDTVILKGFTGIKLGLFVVEKATDKTATILKKDGTKMIFSLKTGKQTNVEEGKEKYANSIMEDDGSYVEPDRTKKRATKKTAKKASKKAVEADEEDEVEEAPKKSKKSAKKAKKVVEEVEEIEEVEDDEDFEDFDEEE